MGRTQCCRVVIIPAGVGGVQQLAEVRELLQLLFSQH